MKRLPLTVATWDYDRVRPMLDGRVPIEGCEVNYLTMTVEECFHRAWRHREFDVAEIGLSPYLIALSREITPYVAIPAFLSRTFRHSAIYIRNDRGIAGPADLRGKRIGVPEYQQSAALWIRGFLGDEFGIAVEDVRWVQAGLEEAGRRDMFPLNLPTGFPLESASVGATLTAMLADGEIERSSQPARRGVSSAATRASHGCFPTIAGPSTHTSRERSSFRSCTRSGSGATSTRRTRGSQRA